MLVERGRFALVGKARRLAVLEAEVAQLVLHNLVCVPELDIHIFQLLQACSSSCQQADHMSRVSYLCTMLKGTQPWATLSHTCRCGSNREALYPQLEDIPRCFTSIATAPPLLLEQVLQGMYLHHRPRGLARWPEQNRGEAPAGKPDLYSGISTIVALQQKVLSPIKQWQASKAKGPGKLHDRALMGPDMQQQAMPVMGPEQPLVGQSIPVSCQEAAHPPHS